MRNLNRQHMRNFNKNKGNSLIEIILSISILGTLTYFITREVENKSQKRKLEIMSEQFEQQQALLSDYINNNRLKFTKSGALPYVDTINNVGVTKRIGDNATFNGNFQNGCLIMVNDNGLKAYMYLNNISKNKVFDKSKISQLINNGKNKNGLIIQNENTNNIIKNNLSAIKQKCGISTINANSILYSLNHGEHGINFINNLTSDGTLSINNSTSNSIKLNDSNSENKTLTSNIYMDTITRESYGFTTYYCDDTKFKNDNWAEINNVVQQYANQRGYRNDGNPTVTTVKNGLQCIATIKGNFSRREICNSNNAYNQAYSACSTYHPNGYTYLDSLAYTGGGLSGSVCTSNWQARYINGTGDKDLVSIQNIYQDACGGAWTRLNWLTISARQSLTGSSQVLITGSVSGTGNCGNPVTGSINKNVSYNTSNTTNIYALDTQGCGGRRWDIGNFVDVKDAGCRSLGMGSGTCFYDILVKAKHGGRGCSNETKTNTVRVNFQKPTPISYSTQQCASVNYTPDYGNSFQELVTTSFTKPAYQQDNQVPRNHMYQALNFKKTGEQDISIRTSTPNGLENNVDLKEVTLNMGNANIKSGYVLLKSSDTAIEQTCSADTLGKMVQQDIHSQDYNASQLVCTYDPTFCPSANGYCYAPLKSQSVVVNGSGARIYCPAGTRADTTVDYINDVNGNWINNSNAVSYCQNQASGGYGSLFIENIKSNNKVIGLALRCSITSWFSTVRIVDVPYFNKITCTSSALNKTLSNCKAQNGTVTCNN